MALPYGDPAELERLAGRIAQRAEEVRALGADVRGRARGTRWQGRAADAFRARIDEELRDVERAAAHLDEAAYACRQQAREVREALAVLAAAERAVLSFLADAGEAILSLPERVLPLHGSVGWLAVSERLRSMGHVL